MKKNLLNRMQRSNEYNRPEYVGVYGGSNVSHYMKYGGKQYTRNESLVADQAVEEPKPETYKADHLLSEEEKQLYKQGSLFRKSWLRKLINL